MNSTLTIRLPAKQRAALRRRAAALRKTESDLVRELIEKESGRHFDFENVRHLAGVLRHSRPAHGAAAWREHLRRANWRK